MKKRTNKNIVIDESATLTGIGSLILGFLLLGIGMTLSSLIITIFGLVMGALGLYITIGLIVYRPKGRHAKR